MMLVATEALRPPKLRIGKIGENFTLPRTVSAVKLITGSLSALGFIAIFGALLGYSVQSVMYLGTIGALVGVGIVSYSPLKDESLARWLGLRVKTRRGRIRMVGNTTVRVAVGICYIEPPVTGPVQALPGAVNVRPRTHDDRGVRIVETRWKIPVVEDSLDIPRLDVPPFDKLDKHRRATGVSNVSAALEAYRSAASEKELPDDFAPRPEPRSHRPLSRWSQDASTLRSLYTTSVEGDEEPRDVDDVEQLAVSDDVLDNNTDNNTENITPDV